jgi:CRP-like cAMP-binding protein
MAANLDQLFEVLSQVVVPDDDDRRACYESFEAVTYSRHSIVEFQGKKPKYLYFIIEGFMRLFRHDDQGDEVTTYLTSSGNFIASFLNFAHEEPSTENIACITDCELLRVDRSTLVSLIERRENFKKFSVTIFEQFINTSKNRADDFATLPAALRYQKLVDEQPELLQNVPIQHIASYLGIKPQSLSRIRAQRIK